MKKPIKRVLAIHDLCGFGKAALTNVMPVLATLGIEVCPIPTMILTTHTGGFSPSIVKLDGYISRAIEHYRSMDINFDGIFIGYLGTEANVHDTLEQLKGIRTDKTLIIFDPIFADNGKYYGNFDKNYSRSLKKLISFSNIITPNFTEACFLAGENIRAKVTEDELLMICRKLHNLGSENVVITSAPVVEKNKIGTAIYEGISDSMKIIVADKLEKSYPGTGDVFASVLVGMLLEANSLVDSVERSCEFVERCIKESSYFDYPIKEGLILETSLKYLHDIK